MSDNWKDIFGSEQPDDNNELIQKLRSMSDEELDEYLRSVGLPEEENITSENDDFSDTIVTNWLPQTGKLKGIENQDISDEATSIIPDDVKRISDITRRNAIGSTRESDIDEFDKMEIDRLKNKSGCMGGFMYFIFILGISIILASLGWLAACDVLALNKAPQTTTIVVPENYDIDDVIDDLKKGGIIEYKLLFKIFTMIADEKIEPGTYQLRTDYDYRAIVSKMQQDAEVEIAEVTIPEGKTLGQTFQLLEYNGICSAKDLWEAAANYDFDYDFLDPDTLGDKNRLEGYLFPDTYEFYTRSKPETVIKKFLNNFEVRVTEEMYNQAEQMGMTMKEIITVASLIEMEAGSNEERATIASVIYNRLNSDFGLLQIDATIQYILGERKEKLTEEDTRIDNPYNTYMYKDCLPVPYQTRVWLPLKQPLGLRIRTIGSMR